MLLNSSIRDLDSKGMILSAEAEAMRPQEKGGMQLVSLEEESERK